MKILGLIPARGGSKGIPNKNRKQLGGKPLLEYTIEAALASKKLSRVIFSSEDEQLIKLAKKSGVDVPFVRPETLASDTAGSLEVVQHALHFFLKQGVHFDAVCLLQVTTPFRDKGFIDKAIQRFIASGTDSLISVQEVPHEYNPHWVFKVSNNGTLKIATGESQIITRRQELPEAFIRDGSIYLTRAKTLLEQNSLYGNSISYIESNPSYQINIDTIHDWEKAEKILKSIPK
ncbi:acylneuraminate cytidylyltransferase family protein [Aureisphaera sp. CAU 1614]|uniref:Acylneuraminate cytidylyltransferase family protein n=1 Tax=Halomarinibacterium sedimenti TaxID=2857106 RepID=A0A9X1FPJ0_9FLAO|nr:acylneuraminate cytidylyltransferase family protein [Halomarinibacterium sedimenti]MBW2937709.1 acylneuraminate cytidylyltransferase family protein [Halomarinibacterium sedimenti]